MAGAEASGGGSGARGSIDYRSAAFRAAYPKASALPASTTPEVAILGRSNVGKSSLLNALFGRKSLAHVSSTPGKTASINFYEVDGVVFVDLPGYGFAKVSNAERAAYGALISGYFEDERSHNLVVQLIDIRHDPTALDEESVGVLEELGLPFVIALTKADKLSRSKALAQRTRVAARFDLEPERVIVTSAAKGTGIAELKRAIAEACL